MVDKLVVGEKLSAEYVDGKFYSAEVVAVSRAPSRAKAPVKVRYKGYGEADDAWLPLASLRSKLLKEVDYSRLTVGARVQVDSDGKRYSAEVLEVSDKPRRAKAPVKVRFLGYTAASDEWVGAARLRSKLLRPDEVPVLLTVETVPAFVAGHMKDSSRMPVKAEAELTAFEIGGGNLNYAFVAKDEDGGAVFVKQAPDFIKVLGKEGPKLTRERMRLEVRWYRDVTRAIGKDASHKYLPRIYTFDVQSMAFIMDFFGDYELLQKTLFDGTADEGAAEALGKFLGLMHSKTHCSKVEARSLSRFKKAYENANLRGIQLEYVFSKCYREHPNAAKLREDSDFMADIELIKTLYKGGKKENLALCHGDLHAGSVMAKGSDVKLIDPEFAVYAPPALDVGSLTSTYALACCFLTATGASGAGHVQAIEALWAAYAETMKERGISDDLISTIAAETVGFSACEIIRTSLGEAYERSMRIPDEALKAKTELAVMELGASCIRSRSTGLEALTSALKAFAVN